MYRIHCSLVVSEERLRFEKPFTVNQGVPAREDSGCRTPHYHKPDEDDPTSNSAQRYYKQESATACLSISKNSPNIKVNVHSKKVELLTPYLPVAQEPSKLYKSSLVFL